MPRKSEKWLTRGSTVVLNLLLDGTTLCTKVLRYNFLVIADQVN